MCCTTRTGCGSTISGSPTPKPCGTRWSYLRPPSGRACGGWCMSASPIPRKIRRLEYFAGKARLERALQESGLEYSILRPTVLFGREDILINNIAWALRRFPLFAVFGDGEYRLQPICVEDLAGLAVAEGGRTGIASSTPSVRKHSPIRHWWRRSARPSEKNAASSMFRRAWVMPRAG